jgi:hypothetical protein
MARRTLSHKALRADFDAAERRKAEGTGEIESGVEAEAAPAKRKAAPKTAKPKRTRTVKSERQRVVWDVFNNSNARVETFPYPQKQEAEEYAAKLKAEKGATYFVQPVKEPIEG